MAYGLTNPGYGPGAGPAGVPYVPASTERSGLVGALTKNVSAVALLVVSVITTILFGIIGPPTAVMSILALKKTTENAEQAKRFTKTAWLIFALNALVGGIALAVYYWWTHKS